MAFRFIRSLLWSQRFLIAWSILLIMIAAGWCLLNFKTISDYLENYNRRDEMRGDVNMLKREIEDLERQRDELARGGFESEKRARERFNISRPGEHVLILDPPTTNAVSSITATPTPIVPPR